MKNITVIGAGTMGNGIAHVFALNGYHVQLMDQLPDALENALNTITNNLDRQTSKGRISEAEKQNTLNNISLQSDLEAASGNADIIIEAASERLDIKKNIFRALDAFAPQKSIFATNTSSISITELAAVTTRPDRFIGMHFMNPVPVMKLVEIINGYSTSEETTDRISQLAEDISKIPVIVNDYPGFVSNRILMPMINEAIYTLFERVAGVEEIDTVMKLGMAHPMGPLQLADFIGLDVCLAILNVLYDGFGNPKYAPCPLLVNMVNSCNLGRKTGQGFYIYTKASKDLKVSPNFQ